jgi:N-acetylneuraminic acid mutarotase
MKSALTVFLLSIFVGVLLAASESDVELDSLPQPLTNNAVAGYNGRGGLNLVSFMGISSGKNWKAVTNATYSMIAADGNWKTLKPVPGTAGRLGAIAVPAANQIFLLGGYVMDAQGGETTVGDVNMYNPDTQKWFRVTDIPEPVSAAVGGEYDNRYIYLVGGWSKSGPTQAVQVYDIKKAEWLKATPMSGPAVFGHAGAVVDDTIVYVDGALRNPAGKPAFIASDECWMGKIDHKDPTKIEWTKLPAHPGTARYRIAAGGSDKDDKVYFTGGASGPYDSTGQGFDGHPAQPSPMVFSYDLRKKAWDVIHEKVAIPTMDQRGLIVAPHYLVLLGGMASNRAVTAHVTLIPKQSSR